jgi:cellulose synthase/poly-beta-1,6-N-acetylglucosamine synthase-like glycosyltransferase
MKEKDKKPTKTLRPKKKKSGNDIVWPIDLIWLKDFCTLSFQIHSLNEYIKHSISHSILHSIPFNSLENIINIYVCVCFLLINFFVLDLT